MEQINRTLPEEVEARNRAEEQLRVLIEKQRIAGEATLGTYFAVLSV
jgi:hypothetical protein